MATQQPNSPFEDAVSALRSRPHDVDLTRFESEVWSEIALQDQPAGAGFLERLRIPLPAAAGFGVLAILSGSFLGLAQASQYDERSTLAMEERYVQSIHPVLMSVNQPAGKPSQ